MTICLSFELWRTLVKMTESDTKVEKYPKVDKIGANGEKW